ncbi:MAG: hypothetical protein EX271_09400 [Acidimicrobiales bacterium]|nr:hypothetical protein [Hyphomonadaceae bacterium]RZV40813.1 MAG: hypothetical protein EX271_09400 [Acidimicrobiales bacterium]
MNQFAKVFTEHPASVGETYFQHFRHSMSFSIRMITGGFACMAHAFFPFLCVRTGSTQIRSLHDKMVVNRDKLTPCEQPARDVHTFIPEYYI